MGYVFKLGADGKQTLVNDEGLAANGVNTNTPGTSVNTGSTDTSTGVYDQSQFNTWKNDPANADAFAFYKKQGDAFYKKHDNGTSTWGKDGLGGTLLGAGQLALGVASYFEQQKTANKQRHLMDQQAKQNSYNYNKTVADNNHIQQIFNPGNK